MIISEVVGGAEFTPKCLCDVRKLSKTSSNTHFLFWASHVSLFITTLFEGQTLYVCVSGEPPPYAQSVRETYWIIFIFFANTT